MSGLDLDEIRKKIDGIDQQIVELVSQRQHWVVRAGKLKTDRDAVRAPGRVEAVIQKVRALAEVAGADPDMVEHTYRVMIKAFIDLELSVHEDNRSSISFPDMSSGSMTPVRSVRPR